MRSTLRGTLALLTLLLAVACAPPEVQPLPDAPAAEPASVGADTPAGERAAEPASTTADAAGEPVFRNMEDPDYRQTLDALTNGVVVRPEVGVKEMLSRAAQ